MTRQQWEQYLSRFKSSESSFPFGPDAMVFKLKGKMFALVSQNGSQVGAADHITLKNPPADCEMLCGQYEAIKPGYHMNKKHWITVTLNNEVPDALLKQLLETAYGLVLKSLPKKERTAL